jgi:hypothetical protein
MTFMRVELLAGSYTPITAMGSKESGPLVDYGLKNCAEGSGRPREVTSYAVAF